LIVTVLALSLAVQDATPPAAPSAEELERQASRLHHVEANDRSNTDPQAMQEQARQEREAERQSRQTQARDNEADAPPQPRRQDGQGLRPARRANPGG